MAICGIAIVTSLVELWRRAGTPSFTATTFARSALRHLSQCVNRTSNPCAPLQPVYGANRTKDSRPELESQFKPWRYVESRQWAGKASHPQSARVRVLCARHRPKIGGRLNLLGLLLEPLLANERCPVAY